MVQTTSLISYDRIKKTLGRRQLCVLEKLDYNPTAMTNTELSFALDWPINCITGRVKELRDEGLIVKHETRKCNITGYPAIAWRVKNMSEIKEKQLEMDI